MRELRISVPGWIFAITFVLNLVFCPEFVKWLQDPKTILGLKTSGEILPIVLGIFTIFGASPVGFILSSIVFYFFNLRKGYHRIWEKNFPKIYLEKFDEKIKEIPFKKPIKEKEALDSLFSFYWQKSDNKDLTDWVSRRFTTYFLNGSIILAMILGYIFSWVLIYNLTKYRSHNLIIIIGILFTSIILYGNARHTVNDAVNLIVIWLKEECSLTKNAK